MALLNLVSQHYHMLYQEQLSVLILWPEPTAEVVNTSLCLAPLMVYVNISTPWPLLLSPVRHQSWCVVINYPIEDSNGFQLRPKRRRMRGIPGIYHHLVQPCGGGQAHLDHCASPGPGGGQSSPMMASVITCPGTLCAKPSGAHYGQTRIYPLSPGTEHTEAAHTGPSVFQLWQPYF